MWSPESCEQIWAGGSILLALVLSSVHGDQPWTALHARTAVRTCTSVLSLSCAAVSACGLPTGFLRRAGAAARRVRRHRHRQASSLTGLISIILSGVSAPQRSNSPLCRHQTRGPPAPRSYEPLTQNHTARVPAKRIDIRALSRTAPAEDSPPYAPPACRADYDSRARTRRRAHAARGSGATPAWPRPPAHGVHPPKFILLLLHPAKRPSQVHSETV